jgi:hypothetical protein
VSSCITSKKTQIYWSDYGRLPISSQSCFPQGHTKVDRWPDTTPSERAGLPPHPRICKSKSFQNMRRLSLVIAVILTLLFSPFVVSSPTPADPGQGSRTELVSLEELKVGSIIYTQVPIDPEDVIIEDSGDRPARRFVKLVNAIILSILSPGCGKARFGGLPSFSSQANPV